MNICHWSKEIERLRKNDSKKEGKSRLNKNHTTSELAPITTKVPLPSRHVANHLNNNGLKLIHFPISHDLQHSQYQNLIATNSVVERSDETHSTQQFNPEESETATAQHKLCTNKTTNNNNNNNVNNEKCKKVPTNIGMHHILPPIDMALRWENNTSEKQISNGKHSTANSQEGKMRNITGEPLNIHRNSPFPVDRITTRNTAVSSLLLSRIKRKKVKRGLFAVNDFIDATSQDPTLESEECSQKKNPWKNIKGRRSDKNKKIGAHVFYGSEFKDKEIKEGNRQFFTPLLNDLRDYINTEMRLVDRDTDKEGQLAVYREVLRTMSNHFQIFGPIIQETQRAYEEQIIDLYERLNERNEINFQLEEESNKILKMERDAVIEEEKSQKQISMLRDRIKELELEKIALEEATAERFQEESFMVRDLEETVGTYGELNKQLKRELQEANLGNNEAVAEKDTICTELREQLQIEKAAHDGTKAILEFQQQEMGRKIMELESNTSNPEKYNALQEHCEKLNESIKELKRRLRVYDEIEKSTPSLHLLITNHHVL
eukprot:Tbor_TRINITY_DN4672_c0_g1::TRINITY_DN4672_c0_g1_i1::g.14951::m.14951